MIKRPAHLINEFDVNEKFDPRCIVFSICIGMYIWKNSLVGQWAYILVEKKEKLVNKTSYPKRNT